MNTRKRNNMLAAYSGFCGPRTVGAITDQIPADLFDRLTGHELGIVMDAVNAAYHKGRASHGGVDVQDDCLWLPDGDPNGDGKLIPLAILRQIEVDEDLPLVEVSRAVVGTCDDLLDADGSPVGPEHTGPIYRRSMYGTRKTYKLAAEDTL